MSSSASASATASLPEIRSSLSSPTAGAVCVAVAAISLWPPARQRVLCSAFSPGMPAVISTPPTSRSAFSSCSYCPRKRKPCERTVAFLFPILAPSHVLYAALSFRHISHWLALSSNSASFTIVMQCSTGHTASHTPAAARLHVGIEGGVGHHVEARVRAGDPAEVALHTGVEVDHRAHGARGELFEVRVALGHVALPALLGLADGDGRDRDTFPHLPPLRHLER